MLSSLLRATWRRTLFLTTWLALLAACGGGVDSGGTGSYASGPITGYGSIIVGGVHYDETTAQVQDDDGTPRTAADLQLGMVTDIQASAPAGAASMPTATAMSVRYRSEIIGPVTALPTTTGWLKVLGQSVKVSATTVIDARLVGGLTALQLGDIVEVYGQLDTQARRYTATRIEPRAADTPAFKLRGLVTSLDDATKTLVIGGQTIDYAGIAAMPAVTAGRTLLRVQLQPVQVAGAWVATTVEIGVRKLPDRDRVEIEGRVTAFNSIASFEVDGIPVDTDATTRFPDGTAGVVLGTRVGVEGSSRDGRLLATQVSIEGDDHGGPEPFEISGTIASGSLDTVAQTFVVRGFTVHWSDATLFGSSTAASLREGRKVELKGALSSDGTKLEASSIHVETGD